MVGSCARQKEESKDAQSIQVRKTTYKGTIAPISVTKSAIIPPIKIDITVSEKVETETLANSTSKEVSTIAPEAIAQISTAIVESVLPMIPIPIGSVAKSFAASSDSDSSLLYSALSGLAGAISGGAGVHLANKRRLAKRRDADKV
jgi:hypothetical protein